MGLMDDVGSALTDGANQGGSDDMMGAIGGLIGGNAGGLQGLVESFTGSGLGDTVSSWIGSGSNLPISGEQIQSALGSDQIQAIASKLGISSEEATSGIASVLPKVIDSLTPDGNVPDGDALQSGLGGLMKGFGL
jgi:uncharacterized protein YidB (DUF937 family)